jgi:hypothetical protein
MGVNFLNSIVGKSNSNPSFGDIKNTFNRLIPNAKGKMDGIISKAKDLNPGGASSLIGSLADKAATGLPNSGSDVTDASSALDTPGAAPGGEPDADTKSTFNAAACSSFEEMYKANQTKYNDEVFKGLNEYFQSDSANAKLTEMLGHNIGRYIGSPGFGGIITNVVKEAVHSVILDSLRTELKNPENFSGMCNEIKRLAAKRRTMGGARRPRKKRRTVKRRN